MKTFLNLFDHQGTLITLRNLLHRIPACMSPHGPCYSHPYVYLGCTLSLPDYIENAQSAFKILLGRNTITKLKRKSPIIKKNIQRATCTCHKINTNSKHKKMSNFQGNVHSIIYYAPRTTLALCIYCILKSF